MKLKKSPFPFFHLKCIFFSNSIELMHKKFNSNHTAAAQSFHFMYISSSIKKKNCSQPAFAVAIRVFLHKIYISQKTYFVKKSFKLKTISDNNNNHHKKRPTLYSLSVCLLGMTSREKTQHTSQQST
jgi:methylmalonyl-CoA mutase N-terminal domain/subunit